MTTQTDRAALHDLCLIANALIQARATVYSTTAAVSVQGFQIDPESLADEAGMIYLALLGKATHELPK